MRIWKIIKAWFKGVLIALAVAVPMASNVYAKAPTNIQYPRAVQYHSDKTCRQEYTYDGPMFKYNGEWNTGYTQTIYDVVQENGVQVSYGLYWNDNNMRVHNNNIQYYDDQYGWLQVYALNIDMVKQFGTVVTSDMLGSVIEVRFPDGSFEKGVVLDVCGACASAKKIDRYVYDMSAAKGNGGHTYGVDFRFVRFGFTH